MQMCGYANVQMFLIKQIKKASVKSIGDKWQPAPLGYLSAVVPTPTSLSRLSALPLLRTRRAGEIIFY
jgi:hypothetical protein